MTPRQHFILWLKSGVSMKTLLRPAAEIDNDRVILQTIHFARTVMGAIQ